MKTIIGIDFGTTKTAVAMTTIGARFEPEIIEIDGKKTHETVFRLDENCDNVEEFGVDAWDGMLECPDRMAYEFKTRIGTSEPYRVGNQGKPRTAYQLSVMFLKRLREKIEQQQFNGAQLNDEDYATVIGYPAQWNKAQKKETIRAAKKAGFPNVQGCEEPIAVLYYHHYKGDLIFGDKERVLVYDLGGGTTDVALVEVEKDQEPKTLDVGGDWRLGGRDFDKALEDYFVPQVVKSKPQGSEPPLRDQMTVRKYCRELKEKMCLNAANGRQEAEVIIPSLGTKRQPQPLKLTQDEFDTICRDPISRCGTPIADTLDNLEMSAQDISRVVIAGGASRMYHVGPAIQEKLPHIDPSRVIKSANPQEAIAKGLAIFGRIQRGGNAKLPKEERHPKAVSKPDMLPHRLIRRMKMKKKRLVLLILIACAVIGLVWVSLRSCTPGGIIETEPPDWAKTYGK
jgi:molecular chaperone DnaK